MNVVVVNEDRQIGRALARMLGHYGHDTRTARRALEALELLRRERADLLITDSTLAFMDGLELLRRVKEEFPALPAIMVTGQVFDGWAEEMAELGYPPPVELPIPVGDLIGYVERATRR